MKFYSYKKGGGQSFSCAEGGGGAQKVYRFDGPLSKIGTSPELSIHFINRIHQILPKFEFSKILCF